MNRLSKLSLFLTCLLVALVAGPAKADPITFTYTVTGNANAVQEGSLLKYSFVPLSLPTTVLGQLDVRYQGTIDFSKAEPNGPTTTVWSFGALGTFTGTGLEKVGPPDANGIAAFSGTSVITGGTGIFAGATGTTSYTGTFNVITGVATFTETITINAPGLTAPVPEPGALLLLGTGLLGLTARIRQKMRRRSGAESAPGGAQ